MDMALTEVLRALLIFFHVEQYSEKFYRTQLLTSHSWENLSLHVKKNPTTNKKIFLQTYSWNETSITNKCSETWGGIKRNHYFSTAWIFFPDSLLLTICWLQFSSVQLPTVTLRWSREGFLNENGGKGQACFHTPTGNERKTVNVREKKSAEAIALTAAYSTQDRQTIKCKETKTRSESSLHTTNWCSKTIIQMFLTIFVSYFQKTFLKLSQRAFHVKSWHSNDLIRSAVHLRKQEDMN